MSKCILLKGGGGADTDVVTASAEDVLLNKVIVDKDVNPLTGTMPNNGAVAPSALGAGGSYTIPAGYHNGSGKVTVQSLATMTAAADALASQIIVGRKAYVDGVLIDGAMPNNGTVTPSALTAGGSYTIPLGYHSGSGKVTAKSLADQTSATAAAGDILTGKTAYVNGSKVTGSMATLAGGTYTPSASQQTISCSGKKMTSNIVINAIPSNYQKNEIATGWKTGSTSQLTYSILNSTDKYGMYYADITYTSRGYLPRVVFVFGVMGSVGQGAGACWFNNGTGLSCMELYDGLHIVVDGSSCYVTNTAARLPIRNYSGLTYFYAVVW